MSADDRTDDIRSAVSRKAGSSSDTSTTEPSTTEPSTTDTSSVDPAGADTTRTDLDLDTTPTETIMDTDRATYPAAPSTPATPATPATVHDDVVLRAPAPDRGVRVGTVVWGLVIAAVGIGLIAYASGLRFDVDLAVIILIAAAGIALLGGSLLTNRRRPR